MMVRDNVPDDFKNIIEIPMSDVIDYQEHEIGNIFLIPLKVPSENDKFLDDHRHYTKSNINVCYAAPRNQGKPRKWYETQVTIPAKTRTVEGYPHKGIPFFVVTDDGFGFLAHTTSDNNKQFAAVGDELILGRWLKGRLVSEGLINPIADVSKDVERKGMITKELLKAYGSNALALQKTDQRTTGEKSLNTYEVWTLKMIWVGEANY
jgi:hypothetical protein